MTQPDMTPYTPKEIEEMRRLINAERYAEYHAYNYTHRHRDWSLHAANIVAGNGPDAANVRAFLRWYFGDEMTEGLRIRISAAVANADFKWIANHGGKIPADFEAVENEVVNTMVREFEFLAESFPGTMTYGSMVGADTIDNIENYFKVAISTIVGLWAFATTSDTPPEGAIVLENGVILNPNDEFGGFVGIHQEKEEMIRRGFFPILLAILRHALTDPDNKNRAPQGIGVPMWDILPLPEEDVDPGATPPSQPPIAPPGSGDSRVAPPSPRSMSAPVEDRPEGGTASDADLPTLAPISVPAEPSFLRESEAAAPDPLRALLPGLDRGPAIEVPALATPALPATDRPLVAHEIEATPHETSGDPGQRRIDATEVKASLAETAAQPVAEAESDAGFDFDAAEEALEAEIAVALTALERLRLARSRFPGMLVDRDRDVIRLTSISAIEPSAAAETEVGDDGAGDSHKVRHHPGPRLPAGTLLPEARLREIARKVAREELAAMDRRLGVNFRDGHYIRFPRG